MKRILFALGLSLLAAPAFAQLQPPDPATLQRLLDAAAGQRNMAFNLAAEWEARARGSVDDIAKANARIKELEPKEAELAKANARIKELEPKEAELAKANARIKELEADAPAPKK